MDSIVWRESDVSSASHRWASRNPSIIRARIGVTAIFFANGFAVGAWAVAIPLVKALFGLSDAMLSLELFAAGAGAIAAMPVAGLLPSRMGGTGMTLRHIGADLRRAPRGLAAHARPFG